jgi:ubiquinone/menaquinone biosynthesis C-methylase UbiE/predicted kinase
MDKMIKSIILFCGLPATLKTYLSVRLSGRLGYAYMPTKAIGSIYNYAGSSKLYQKRIDRYSVLAKAVQAAHSFGANIVVDGGFPTSVSRKIVLDKTNPEHTILIHCICDDQTRIKRLERRAKDKLDYENESAEDILQNLKDNKDLMQEENPEAELNNGKVNSLLTVDTKKMDLSWKGNPPTDLCVSITIIIKELLEEYSQNKFSALENEITHHFNDFAGEYDNTTEWRKDDEILKSLQTNSIPDTSRVLDIGTGTGLASEWYTKQGHLVAGIDISPKMLQKASDRLNFVLLGNGTQLPFIDNYFDLIIIRQCLHYVNAMQLLQETHRVLKIGGLIVVSGAICTSNEIKHFWTEFKNATQPLRLEIFTPKDIKDLLENSGYKIIKEKNYSLIRKDKIVSIEKRARNIPGGLHSFLINIEKLSSKLFPELEFKIQNEQLEYRQNWVTIWAEK